MTDKSISGLYTVQFHTLGCKLNFSESATMERLLADHGIRRAKPGEEPDVCVVNTCSVTELADKKCRQAIRRLAKSHPGALIIVTGCYAQLKSDEVAAIDGVNIVMGNDRKNHIARLIEQWQADRVQPTMVDVHEFRELTDFCPSCSRGDRTRYFLKVQDGCDYFCTYCTIPFARGRSRSATIDSLVEQARQAAAEGGKEIVLTGVNIGDFGKNTGERFIDLVKALDAVEGIERYRISSIEPDLLDDEVIDFVAQSRRFMPHFHIPLQSGSDEVLKLMHRHYDTALYARKIEKIHSAMPDAFIGVDVMVGTRGETAELFKQSRDFIASLDVSRLHVFPYSERPGTVALRIDYVVDKHEKEERVAEMLRLSDDKLRLFTSQYLGTRRQVLLEHPARGCNVMHGFTDNYLRVEVPRHDELANCITTVSLDCPGNDVETVNGTIVAP